MTGAVDRPGRRPRAPRPSATRRSCSARSCWPCCSSPWWPGRWSGRCARCATARCGSPTTTWRAKSSGCAPARSPAPSSRSRCTPPRRSARSPTPSTNCTSRPSSWPASRAGCSCRSATCSRRCRGAAASLVDQQLSLIDRLERNEEDPERLESLFRLDHLAARMRRNGANLLVLAGAKVPREQADAGARRGAHQRRGLRGRGLHPRRHRDGARQRDRRAGRGRPRAPARRAARQRAALLAADLAGAGVGRAHRKRRAGHRGQRHRARHDRIRSAGGQHASAVRRRGDSVHRPPHGSVRGRPAGRSSTGWWSGCAAPLRENRIRAPPRASTCRPSCSCARACATRSTPARRAAPADAHSGIATALALAEADEYDEYDDEVGVDQLNGHSEFPSRFCRSATPEPAASPDSAWAVEEDLPGPSRNPSMRPRGLDEDAAGRSRRRQPRRRPSTPLRSSRPASTRRPTARTPRRAGGPAGARVCGGARGTRGSVAASEPAESSKTAGADDAIYQKMLSEWLIDPTELAKSSDLNWESVWDHGWTAAEAAEDAPVVAHTDEGCRCATPVPGWCPGRLGPRRSTARTAAIPTAERTEATTMTR